MYIIHKKGNHYSFPPVLTFKLGINSLEETYEFNDESRYSIEKEEMWDWNKLTGITKSLNPLKDTVMIGWRVNPETLNFEFTPYIHDYTGNKPREMFDPIIIFKQGEIKIKIKLTKDKYLIWLNDIPFEYTKGSKYTKGFRVPAWFGGNCVPNKDIKFKLISKKYD